MHDYCRLPSVPLMRSVQLPRHPYTCSSHQEVTLLSVYFRNNLYKECSLIQYIPQESFFYTLFYAINLLCDPELNRWHFTPVPVHSISQGSRTCPERAAACAAFHSNLLSNWKSRPTHHTGAIRCVTSETEKKNLYPQRAFQDRFETPGTNDTAPYRFSRA